MGRFEDMVEGLREDIEVPESVWGKYTNTLYRLPDQKKQASRMAGKGWKWPVAAAAALFVGVAGISAAAYMQWSSALEERLQITEEQHQELEESRMASAVGQSVTQNGVTVTAEESIVDNHFAHLSFKVEGYELEEGEEPGFGQIGILVDNKDSFDGGWNASFYDGLVPGNNGKAVHAADGTPVAEEEEIRYTMEDGSLEFIVTMTSRERGYFIGKPIHVELKELGSYAETAGSVVPDVEGTWSFDWVMEGSKEMKMLELNEELGDSGAAVVKAELSPISVSLLYDFPMQEETELGEDADGEPFVYTTYVEPPYFSGVRLKDGTLYTGISGAGSSGYADENHELYEFTTALNRVIDVDQVESLAFVRFYPEGEQALTEENLYFVPIA